MKQMWTLAWAGLNIRRRSSFLLLTTITFSVMFLVVIGLVGNSSLYTLESQNKDLYGGQKVVIWNLNYGQLAQVKKQPVWSEIGRISAFGSVDSKTDIMLAIGTMDETAMNLGHIRLLSGRMPRTADEIVLEKSAYKHIGNKEYMLGETVTLNITTVDGNVKSCEYVVCGIIDSYSAVWQNAYGIDNTDGHISPVTVSFILSKQGGEALSGKTQDTFLLGSKSNTFNDLKAGLPKNINYCLNYIVYPHIGFFGGMGEEQSGIIGISSLIGGMVLIFMMLILLNGFLMAVDKRKMQLSLIRSIGATKKQAFRWQFCEAALLMSVGIPMGLCLGTALSFAAVRLFSLVNQSDLLYRFNGWVLVVAVAACILCVCLAVLLPAVRASKCAPIAGVRPVYFVRKRKPAHKSRKGIRLSPFSLMLISIRKSKMKTILTVVTFSFVIILFNFMILFNLTAYKTGYKTADIALNSTNSSAYDLVIEPNSIIKDLTPSIFNNVRNCVPTAFQNANLQPLFYCDIPINRYDEYLNGYFHFDYKMLGISGRHDSRYNLLTEQTQYGYSDQEYLISPFVSAFDKALLSELSEYVVDGKIDAQAINRGEEIVLCMPDYAVTIKYDDYSIQTSVALLSNNPRITPNTTVHTNTNWKAGDSLTLTWVEKQGEESFEKHLREVKIGAIVCDTPPTENDGRGVFGMVVGEHTLQNLQLPFNISKQVVYFEDTEDIEKSEAEIKRMVLEKYPMVNVATKTEQNLAEQRIRLTTISVMSMLTICLLSLSFLGLINTVSSRINNRMHEIGLLRCIGMTKGQILRTFVYEGAVFGVLASLLGVLVCLVMFPKLQENWTQTAMPLFLLLSCMFCMLLSAVTIFIPANNVLKSNPTETIHKIM